jgi:hypothetical protein
MTQVKMKGLRKMIDNERRMTDFERYRSMHQAKQLPTFSNVEDAELALPLPAADLDRGNTIGSFLLKREGQLGLFVVCVAYVSQSRDSDPSWSYRESWSFSAGEMYFLKLRAAEAIGLELIESMVQ